MTDPKNRPVIAAAMFAVGIVLIALAIGLSSGDSSPSRESAPTAPAFNAPAPERQKAKPVVKSSSGAKLDLTPEQRDLYIEARTVCGLVPPAQVAGDFGMSPDSNPAAIARRYARAYPDPGLNGAAELGCYAGLVARD